MDKAKVREWLRNTDGYSIVDPSHFIEMGLPESKVKRYVQTYSDDPDLGKHAAHRNDGKSGPVKGVAEFSAVRLVARELGVDLSQCPEWMGRGKQFREYAAAVLKAL